MAELVLQEIQLIKLPANDRVDIEVTKNEVWKIESAGLGGTNGSIFLCEDNGEKLAILYSSVNKNDFSSQLPFLLFDFKGVIVNESSFQGLLSITISTIS
jgi:hypothetical protein